MMSFHVPLELIGSTKAHSTIWMATRRHPFASMPPKMGAQVRCFLVLFAATGVMANVHQLLAIGPILLLC
jgi:hypothetical protein